MLTCVRNELSSKVWKTLGNHRGSCRLHHCLSLPPKCLYGGSEGGTCKPAYCVNLRICWPCIIFILHNKNMQADTGTNGPGYIFIALLLYHLAYEEFGVWGGFCLQRPSWEGFFFLKTRTNVFMFSSPKSQLHCAWCRWRCVEWAVTRKGETAAFMRNGNCKKAIKDHKAQHEMHKQQLQWTLGFTSALCVLLLQLAYRPRRAQARVAPRPVVPHIFHTALICQQTLSAGSGLP